MRFNFLPSYYVNLQKFYQTAFDAVLCKETRCTTCCIFLFQFCFFYYFSGYNSAPTWYTNWCHTGILVAYHPVDRLTTERVTVQNFNVLKFLKTYGENQ